MIIYDLPKSVIRTVERLIIVFIWGSSMGGKRRQ